MVLRNGSTGAVVASSVEIAHSTLQRSVGLLTRKAIDTHEGMFFPRCCMLHTLGMRAPIDVIFLDADDRIVQLRPGVRPNRLLVACVGAASAIELGAGALEATDLLVGDRLLLEP